MAAIIRELREYTVDVFVPVPAGHYPDSIILEVDESTLFLGESLVSVMKSITLEIPGHSKWDQLFPLFKRQVGGGTRDEDEIEQRIMRRILEERDREPDELPYTSLCGSLLKEYMGRHSGKYPPYALDLLDILPCDGPDRMPAITDSYQLRFRIKFDTPLQLRVTPTFLPASDPNGSENVTFGMPYEVGDGRRCYNSVCESSDVAVPRQGFYRDSELQQRIYLCHEKVLLGPINPQ